MRRAPVVFDISVIMFSVKGYAEGMFSANANSKFCNIAYNDNQWEGCLWNPKLHLAVVICCPWIATGFSLVLKYVRILVGRNEIQWKVLVTMATKS